MDCGWDGGNRLRCAASVLGMPDDGLVYCVGESIVDTIYNMYFLVFLR